MPEKIIEDLIELYDSWKNGIFADMGIRWTKEPPSILAAREWLARQPNNIQETPEEK